MGKSSKLGRHKRTERAKQVAGAQPRRTEENKKRKLAKHVREYPNDIQAQGGST